MPGPKSGSRPRMGGGMNASLGGFNEHLDENAIQQAMGQKQLGQQATSQQAAVKTGQGGGKAQQDLAKLQAMNGVGGLDGLKNGQGLPAGLGQAAGGQVKQREVGTLKDELITRPLQDIATEIKSIFDINRILGINPQTDTPEEQAKKKQTHQRWQQLTQEEQQVAQRRYQEEMQKKQQQEEADEMRRQQAEQARASTIQAPSSPQKGPKGPGGSGKQRAQTKLENDRKTLGGAKGSN